MAIDHSDPKYDTDPDVVNTHEREAWIHYSSWPGIYIEPNAESRAIRLVEFFENALNDYEGLILQSLGYTGLEVKKIRCITDFLRLRIDTDPDFLKNHYGRFVMLARKKQEYNFRVANFNSKKGSS